MFFALLLLIAGGFSEIFGIYLMANRYFVGVRVPQYWNSILFVVYILLSAVVGRSTAQNVATSAELGAPERHTLTLRGLGFLGIGFFFQLAGNLILLYLAVW